MAEITAALVKQLRDSTGAGMMECKRALVEADGDLEKARDLLRKQGLAKSAKLAGRAANEGVIAHYVHSSGGAPARVGALVELNCETDFVARNEDFQQLARELALQVAGARPQYVARDDVPAAVLEREKAVYADQVQGKPENIIEKILAGKLEAFYREVCLVDQEYIRVDEHGQKRRISDLVGEVAAKLREHVTVAGFVRFEVGQEPLVARASTKSAEAVPAAAGSGDGASSSSS